MVKKLTIGCGILLILLIVLGTTLARTLLKPEVKPERSETTSIGDVEIKVVETGTIQPFSKVDVKSYVSGRIAKLFVDEGAIVTQGQILAMIDPREINNQVAALQAQLRASRARQSAAEKTVSFQQDQTVTGIDQYLQNLAAAKAHLQQTRTLAKIQPMLTTQGIAIAKANLEAAEATLKAQQDSLSLLVETTHPNAVVSAQSAYDEDKAQSDNAHRNFTRQRQLLTRGFVAQQVVDSAETDAAVADSHLRDAKQKLDRIIKANEIEEENARSQVANAQGLLNQTRAALLQAQSDTLPQTRIDDVNGARAAYAQAQAQLAAARSNRTQDKMRHDEALAAAADAQQIQNQLNQSLVTQSETTLFAPMTGVVTKRYVEKGDLISSGIDSFSSGTPVLQVADLHTMLVKINVNEVDINKVQHGMLTEVSIDGARGTSFIGHVSKVSPSSLTDASSGSTGSSSTSNNQSVIRFPVDVRIDHADSRLKPGMSAHCTIVVARRPKVIRVPLDCISYDGPKAMVKVVTSTMQNSQPVETVKPREVQIGLRGDEFVEILSGLHEGEKLRPNSYSGPTRQTIDMNMN